MLVWRNDVVLTAVVAMVGALLLAVRGVHDGRAAAARPALEARLAEHAKSWELTAVLTEGGGLSTLEYQVHLKKKVEPHA